uniref:Uncharacterized protein n=1 Tax=Talaromyces marneffei PM1 TaxID=1077442 RepID=A0A093V8R8_TALMA
MPCHAFYKGVKVFMDILVTATDDVLIDAHRY